MDCCEHVTALGRWGIDRHNCFSLSDITSMVARTRWRSHAFGDLDGWRDYPAERRPQDHRICCSTAAAAASTDIAATTARIAMGARSRQS